VGEHGAKRRLLAQLDRAQEQLDGFAVAQAPGRGADRRWARSTPEPFLGVGRWYADFSQTSDEEVERLLERAAAGTPSS
jgi:predicted phosphoribosyltransferase